MFFFQTPFKLIKLKFIKLKNYMFKPVPQGLRVLDYILEELYKYPKEEPISKDDFKDKIIDKKYNSQLYHFLEGNKKVDFETTTIAKNNFDHAIDFLNSNSLIVSTNSEIRITFSGIIKYEKGGYTKDFKDLINDKKLQRMSWFISLPALLISIALSINEIFC